jgi:catechol 2,3-dioxygenase-like lactoylglutathione lyase family enzyme
MLGEFPMSARIAASDIARAKAWYRDKLGLTPQKEEMGGTALWYRSGQTWFFLYQTESAGTANNTVGGWEVSGIEAVMDDLRSRGVVFEDYDFGEMKTVNGLLSAGDYKACWFKDCEGNVMELTEAPAG